MSKKRKKSRIKVSQLPLILSLIITGVFVLIIAGFVLISLTSRPMCANSISCINDLTGKKSPENKGIFSGKTVYAPELSEKMDLDRNKSTTVLGDRTEDFKHIYVDLTDQRLYAFDGNNIVMNVPVSTGKWNPTPTGDFRIWIWLRYQTLTGGSGANYYNLPNVPYIMYFYNNSTPKEWGYGLHGAYWHNNFGHPMSYGCINMRIADVEKLFYWTNPNAGNVSYPTSDDAGTAITIYGETPKE